MCFPCPRCGGHAVHHSRLRSRAEQIRSRLTGRVPFRCHSCDWRGWRHDTGTPAAGADLRQIHRGLTEAELERLDPTQAKNGKRRT